MAAQPSSALQNEVSALPLITVDTPAVTFTKIIDVLKVRVPKEPKGGSAKGYSIRSMTSWEGVREMMDRAATEYDSKSGTKGKTRIVGKFIGNKAEPAKKITAVIPDLGYTKPIVGTLLLFLDACQKAGKVRDDVKNAIEKLRDHFDLVQLYLELYASKPKVAEAALELNVTILIAIEKVIDYYTGNIAIKGLKALLGGEKYQEKLLACLKAIDDAGQKLILQADTAQKQETQHGFSGVEAKLDIQQEMIEEGRTVMKRLLSLLEQQSRKLDEMDKESQAARQQVEMYFLENMMLRERLKPLTTPGLRPSEPIITLDAMAIQEPTTTRVSLLEFLDLSDMAETDITYITRTDASRGAFWRDKTNEIMESNAFIQWNTDPTNRELLIHGNSAVTPVSPLSLFCAMLIRDLRQVQGFVCLAFFCGCHPYEDQGGPRTLIISLLAQLLQQRTHFDLRFLTYEMAELMEAGDVRAYCSVFGQLVQQMARDETVFCIIDGANFYERVEEMRHEFAEVLCFLLDLTNSQTRFKILLTSPSITIEIRKAIRNEDYLSLPEQEKSTGDFSLLRFERQWDESMQHSDN